jgi:Mce-associated membrane protein
VSDAEGVPADPDQSEAEAVAETEESGSSRRARVVKPGSIVVLVGAILVVGLVVVGYLNWREDGRQDSAETAQKEISVSVAKILSYQYDTINDELRDELPLLAGSFADDFQKLVTDTIAPAAIKAKVTTQAEISESAVVSESNDRVELLIFVNVTTSSSRLKEPRVTGSRLAVTAKKIDGHWRISNLDPV